jgi:hypothetical protein
VTRFHFERILEKEEKKEDENVLLGSFSSFFFIGWRNVRGHTLMVVPIVGQMQITVVVGWGRKRGREREMRNRINERKEKKSVEMQPVILFSSFIWMVAGLLGGDLVWDAARRRLLFLLLVSRARRNSLECIKSRDWISIY